MPFGKGRRKLWLVLGVLATGLAMIWFGCPLWLPWLLRPLASRAGATFGAYEREGYSRFVLNDLSFTNQGLVLKARKAVAVVPTVWLWRLGSTSHAAQSPFLFVTNWDCQLLPSGKPAQPTVAQVHDVAAIFSKLQRWLPLAVVRDGRVRSGNTTLPIPQSTWTNGSLEAWVKPPGIFSNETIRAEIKPAHPFELSLSLPEQKADASFVLATNLVGMNIQSFIQWQSNRVDTEAHFSPKDVLPESASLKAENLHLPASALPIHGYQEITGSLTASWRNGKFTANLAATAQPSLNSTNFPVLDVKMRAEGNTNVATLQTLDVHTPFLRAELSQPVAVAFSAPFLQGPATLRVAADLAQQGWFAASGKVEGQADISPGPNAMPRAQFRLHGAEIRYQKLGSLTGQSMDIAAHFSWPDLEISSAEIRLDDGSRLEAGAKLDLDQKTVAGGHFEVSGPLLQKWLPEGYSCQNVDLRGNLEGSLTNLAHSGRLLARQVETPWLQPLGLDLNWKGKAQNLESFEIRLAGAKGSLTAAGALSITGSGMGMKLTSLELATNEARALRLTQPVTIALTTPHTNAGWVLETTLLRCEGPAGQLDAQARSQWPTSGSLELSLQHVSDALLSGFIESTMPRIEVKQLISSVAWSNGPATLSLVASGTGTANEHPESAASEKPISSVTGPLLATPLNFEVRLNGDEHGLMLSNLVINTATSSVATARGFLPVAVTPASTNLFALATDAHLQLDVAVRPQAFFWHQLALLTKVNVDEPNLDLDLGGTWLEPQGKVEFRARAIQLLETNSLPIQFSDLRLGLVVDRQMARLSEGQVLIQGQRVGITGELPLGDGAWTNAIHGKMPNWEKATARLVSDAQLAAFEPLFPQLLAPQGSLNLDLRLLPGSDLQGAVTIRRARTRPLGTTAPFRDINVTLRFHDRLLSLENATANLSGAEVNLSGKADLRGTNWLHGELPPFDLVLRGTNVPVARQPEYIIRSDLDLAVSKTNGAPPLVYGTAHLRDSFFLSDLSGLIPDKAASPGSRPPYFSIDTPTLANWRLAITVDGVHWLKLRTSLFNGEASANLHLQGSLKEPLALGVLKIDSGLVRFPFANLQVQQGLVTLASQDPYHPQLLVRASSKQFGYDIHMEVSGPVDSPVIQFTSNPSLSSEQILLMITAGQLPAGTLTLTPQQRAQTVALFLGRDLLSKLGLGDQSKDRLTISSGEEMSEQGKPTYHVEYKLTNRWSVEGEYDRFGDFNADLKWRIYSK